MSTYAGYSTGAAEVPLIADGSRPALSSLTTTASMGQAFGSAIQKPDSAERDKWLPRPATDTISRRLLYTRF
jgi:hypothetical protein